MLGALRNETWLFNHRINKLVGKKIFRTYTIIISILLVIIAIYGIAKAWTMPDSIWAF